MAIISSSLRSLIEKAWNEVLGIDETYEDGDDFFLLGGHSLLVLVVAEQLERKIGRPIPIETMLTHTRMGDLVAALESM